MRRATHRKTKQENTEKISIHALREEGDEIYHALHDSINISIHALREEGDILEKLDEIYHALFLSTPSVRRATVS